MSNPGARPILKEADGGTGATSLDTAVAALPTVVTIQGALTDAVSDAATALSEVTNVVAETADALSQATAASTSASSAAAAALLSAANAAGFVQSSNLQIDDSNAYIFALNDPDGSVGALIDRDGALRGRYINFNDSATTVTVRDEQGNIAFNLDETGLGVGRLTANAVTSDSLIADDSITAGGNLQYSSAIFEDYDDPAVALVIRDEVGWIISAQMANGTLINAGSFASGGGAISDFTSSEISQHSNRALAYSAQVQTQVNTTTAAPVWNYSNIAVSGQSYGAGMEGWPSLGTSAPIGVSGVYMVGLSVHMQGGIGSSASTTPTPYGDANFHAAVSTVHNGTSLLDAAAQAALSPGDTSEGEESGIAAAWFVRKLGLQTFGLAQDTSRQIAVTNAAVAGRSIAQLSKGATPTEWFNRHRVAASAVKAAALALNGSNTVGLVAVIHDQGQADEDLSTDGATYKTKTRQYFSDITADIATTIYGQAQPPAFFMFQTCGPYINDVNDLAVSMAQLQLSDENSDIFMIGPTYAAPDKGGHLYANGYRGWMGCQAGKVLHIVINQRRQWQPLRPIQITIRGKTILIDFHVPQPPLQFQPAWVGRASGPTLTATTYPDKGFAVFDDSGANPSSSVTLVGDATVQIVLSRTPVGTSYVYYGRASDTGAGNLCDSDPTVAPYNYTYTAGSGQYSVEDQASLNNKPYPLWNWCCLFKMAAVAG